MERKLKIHSENILPIIKKWLYSEKDIFVRELISNACDAITKAKFLFDQGESPVAPELRIEIKQDKEKNTLTFSDFGIGMDSEEVEKYLSQIAFSGAEEFVKAYKADDAFIGHFGLGFYSAYMVADLVEVHTLSCKAGAQPVIWKSDGNASYEVHAGTRTKPGTDVILHLSKENSEYLESARLTQLIKRYAAFLPYPIFLNGSHINSIEPLWIKNPQNCTEEDYRSFYRTLYPFDEDPLFWVHINVEFPFTVRGILYFPRLDPNFDFKKSNVQLYCNRVFVSDDCKDILPEYLTLLKGILDSPDIPLNVSRSYLQVDTTVRKLSVHISNKVADALCHLFKENKSQYIASWKDVEVIFKLGCFHDEKFYQKVKDILLFQTIKNEWITIGEYLEKGSNTIYYVEQENAPKQLLKLYEAKNLQIIKTFGHLDAVLINFLEKEMKTVQFRRVDSLDAHLLDPSREKTLLDADGKTEASNIAAFYAAAVSESSLTVEAKSLATVELPALLSMKEEERRFSDYLRYQAKGTTALPSQKKTLVVNTNNPLVQSIYKLSQKDHALSCAFAKHLLDLTALSHKEMDAQTIEGFVERSIALLETLTKK